MRQEYDMKEVLIDFATVSHTIKTSTKFRLRINIQKMIVLGNEAVESLR